MSGPLGSKEIPPIDKKEYLRLDSNNKTPDVPNQGLFASFLSRDYTATEQEKEEAKQLIISLIKDTFVNKTTLNTELSKYQPVGNYALNTELANYAFKKDLNNYATKSEVAFKYQPIGEYALVSDLTRSQLNTPTTPVQLPVLSPVTNKQAQNSSL